MSKAVFLKTAFLIVNSVSDSGLRKSFFPLAEPWVVYQHQFCDINTFR